jgi:transcriptional regulator GlxA family with amidase domain
MKRISIYVPQSGFMEAISPPYRVFNTVNDICAGMGEEPAFAVEFVGLNKSVSVQNGEYSVNVNRLMNEVHQTDLVIVPAIYGDIDKTIELNKEAIPWLRQMHENGAAVASLCIGAFLLAASGIVNGKKCSTHWAFYNEFREKYPDVELVDGSIITDEGNVYSSGGANSIWNLLLYLVEKYTNRDIAILVAKFYAVDIDRNNQKAFTIFKGQKTHNDAAVLAAQEYIELKYTGPLTIEDLADHVNVSRRSFERRFKEATDNNVMEYVRRVRVEAAKRSFEMTRRNITDVMYDVGYTDTKTFRDVFKKITGLTPIEYRNKYSKQPAMK